MYPKITLSFYENTLEAIMKEVEEEIANIPYAYVANDPHSYPKPHINKLIARHINWTDKDVFEFTRRHKKVIGLLLTVTPKYPARPWTPKEIVSYANVVVGVINIVTDTNVQ